MDTQTVFQLRKDYKYLNGIEKLNKICNALKMARSLYSHSPYDEWTQKALAYVLIDKCKYYISTQKIDLSTKYFNELSKIDFQGNEDEIIENQKKYLRPKIDINYSEIQGAENLSKNGDHQEALDIYKKLIVENRLEELHHESYGWVIYRFIKTEADSLSSVTVRTFLRDYISLKNERPSMLHSMI